MYILQERTGSVVIAPQTHHNDRSNGPSKGRFVLRVIDRNTLLSRTSVAGLITGISQIVQREVVYDGGATNILLRASDRIVRRVRMCAGSIINYQWRI